MKKILLTCLIFIAFFLLIPFKADASGICGSEPHLFPNCPIGGRVDDPNNKVCDQDSDCCTGICVQRSSAITNSSVCNGDIACINAFDRVYNSKQGELFWFQNSIYGLVEVCDNSTIVNFIPTPTPAPPTATPTIINCGSACVKDLDCAGAAAFNCSSCVNNKCAPRPPACGDVCTKDSDCLATAAFNCGTCVGNKCEPPPPTPTLTSTPTPTPTIPACGTPCTKTADCAGASFNCNICGPDNKCAAPTPTPVPPACGTACTKNTDCIGATFNCNLCGPDNKCAAPTATPTPIPPTPTPTFNPASCTCDGINYKNLATGQNATITSFAKITGNDALLGIITGQKFFLTQGADDIHGKIIAQSGLLPASLISQPARYQSVWTFKLPTLISGDTYRIWSQISCQPKNAAYGTSNVAGAATTQKVADNSLLGKLVAFVRHIFGVKDEQNIAVAPTSVPQIASKPAGSAVLGTDSLQLQTINPIDVYQKTCSFIKFRYNF